MMLPEWANQIAFWATTIAGLATLVGVAAFVWWFTVQVICAVRDNHLRSDTNAAAKYMLWLVLRKARRPETDALSWAPPEVERWARERMARLVGEKREVPRC